MEEDIKKFAQKLELDANQKCNEIAYQGVSSKGLSQQEDAMRKEHFGICRKGFVEGVKGVLSIMKE